MGFWPRPELGTLRDWVISDQRLSVLLVTGAGGSGKTRLALELAAEVPGFGYLPLWISADGEQEGLRTARDSGQPVLLVLDYAETRPGLAEMLADVVTGRGALPVRVLLLARSEGDWWRLLIDRSGHEVRQALEPVRPVRLGPVTDAARQQDVFRAAMAAFADRLGVACPDARQALDDPRAVVLVVHAAALLAVLDSPDAGRSNAMPRTRDQVLSGLLGHESAYWAQSQLPRGLDLDLAVTPACCRGGLPDRR